MNRLLIALLFLILPALANAQALWGGTEYGMSVEQVKSAVPSAAPPTGKPGSSAGGALELLRLENVELVNKQFAVRFFFIAGKLTEVTLSLEKGQTPIHGATLVFESLTEALRAKYGLEIKQEINRGGRVSSASATWMAGRTNIDVVTMSVGGDVAFLYINYEVRIATEADKL